MVPQTRYPRETFSNTEFSISFREFILCWAADFFIEEWLVVSQHT